MQYTPYRRTLAWIGFVATYLVLPILILAGIWYVSHLGSVTYVRASSTQTDRPEPFYQQTSEQLP